MISKSGFRSNDLSSGYERLHFPASSQAAASHCTLAIHESERHHSLFHRCVRVGHGAESSSDPRREHGKLDVFLAPFLSLPFDDACAAKCAEIRRALVGKGETIGPHDLQIAAGALRHDLTLVTHNTREFSRILALRLEDWESQAGL